MPKHSFVPSDKTERYVYILIGLLYVDTKTLLQYKFLISIMFDIKIKWKCRRKKVNHKKL